VINHKDQTNHVIRLAKKHFGSTKEIDAEILADYGHWIDKVAADELEHWK
jgi:hypothetical protein